MGIMANWLYKQHYANMLWLDSTYPVDSTGAGSERGSCSTDSGVPADVESVSADASVVYSNIKFGPIGSTFSSTGNEDTGNGGGDDDNDDDDDEETAAHYAQCGGSGYSGPTKCASGYTCKKQNDYYSQCL